jgi:hypothetical protein
MPFYTSGEYSATLRLFDHSNITIFEIITDFYLNNNHSAVEEKAWQLLDRNMNGHCDFIALNLFSNVANFNLELFFNIQLYTERLEKFWKKIFFEISVIFPSNQNPKTLKLVNISRKSEKKAKNSYRRHFIPRSNIQRNSNYHNLLKNTIFPIFAQMIFSGLGYLTERRLTESTFDRKTLDRKANERKYIWP